MLRLHLIVALTIVFRGHAFTCQSSITTSRIQASRHLLQATKTSTADDLVTQKRKLLRLLKPEPTVDPVLADPVTKEPLVVVASSGTILGGQSRPNKVKYMLKASPNATVFEGNSLSYINLLQPADNWKKGYESPSNTETSSRDEILKRVTPLVPPPLRAALSATGLLGDDYIPMRDLFTSPAVSYAYERGWRQGFASAGFPGPDDEARMAMEYFAPAMISPDSKAVLVDMSCATGLFTRRFAKSGKYRRVLGCDYSDSMLEEARKRIMADPDLSGRRKSLASNTQLDLVRLDVGQIPMQTESVDALHAGAAMHCWPDLPAAVREIHRVLKPGGRYFATTFLSSYFGTLRRLAGEESTNMPSRQAFQYFESVDVLRKLLVEEGGFAPEKVFIEVLGNACIVIRAEK